MKIERGAPNLFVPLVITVESKAEKGVLHYLGCAAYQIQPLYEAYLKNQGDTFDCSKEEFARVLTLLRNKCGG